MNLNLLNAGNASILTDAALPGGFFLFVIGGYDPQSINGSVAQTFLEENPADRLYTMNDRRQRALPEIKPETLAAYVLTFFQMMAQEQIQKETAVSHNEERIVESLSVQEQRVLRLLVAGLSNPEIAEELVISVNTVKTHVRKIYNNLGVNSREEACAFALQARRIKRASSNIQ